MTGKCKTDNIWITLLVILSKIGPSLSIFRKQSKNRV